MNKQDLELAEKELREKIVILIEALLQIETLGGCSGQLATEALDKVKIVRGGK